MMTATMAIGMMAATDAVTVQITTAMVASREAEISFHLQRHQSGGDGNVPFFPGARFLRTFEKNLAPYFFTLKSTQDFEYFFYWYLLTNESLN